MHVLPHLWFRNTWSWGPQPSGRAGDPRRSLRPGCVCLVADDSGGRTAAQSASSLFARPALPVRRRGRRAAVHRQRNQLHAPLRSGCASRTPYVKDAFHRHIINGEDCVNPEQIGTKACVHYANVIVPAGGSVVFRLRLTDQAKPARWPTWTRVVAERRREADAFYADASPAAGRARTNAECSGRRWPECSGRKQAYLFDVNAWLEGDDPDFRRPSRARGSATTTGGISIRCAC